MPLEELIEFKEELATKVVNSMHLKLGPGHLPASFKSAIESAFQEVWSSALPPIDNALKPETQTGPISIAGAKTTEKPSPVPDNPTTGSHDTLSDAHKSRKEFEGRVPPSIHDSGYGSLPTKSLATGKFDTVLTVREREEAMHSLSGLDAIEEEAETRTVFSDTSSLLQRPDINRYIASLADELSFCIPPEFSKRNAGNGFLVLEHVFKSFAVRLGHEDSRGPQRQLMYLVYRFRGDIIKRLLQILDVQNDCDIDSENTGSRGNGGGIRDVSPGMPLTEKIFMLWDMQSNDIGGDDAIPGSPDKLDDHFVGPDEDLFELDTEGRIPTQYRETLLKSSAYKWFQSAIRVRATLQVPESDAPVTYHSIGDQIIKASAAGISVKFSRKGTQQLCMDFVIDWDPFAFSREQQYDKPLHLVLAHVITLTGYGNNLLATTCQEYLTQTWPETGSALLSLLQQAVNGGPGTAVFGDATRLAANFENGKLHLNAISNVFSIGEVAEQISWIAAALRCSSSPDEAAYSSPYIAELRIENMSDPEGIPTVGKCKIGFNMHVIHDSELAQAGKCWRGMFGNPVIVTGYPIPCRPEAGTGLEISLSLMAGLTSCQRVVNFASTTFIKGFAAMFTVVRVVGDIVVWHLCYNPEGEYISYEDARSQRSHQTEPLSLGRLQRSRHIVGWSDNVKNYTGRDISSAPADNCG